MHNRRTFLMGTAAAASLAWAGVAGPGPARAQGGVNVKPRLGIAAPLDGLLYSRDQSIPIDTYLGVYMAKVKQLGATSVRFDIPWRDIEIRKVSTASGYNFAQLDSTGYNQATAGGIVVKDYVTKIVNAATAAGLEPVGILAYAPGWACDSPSLSTWPTGISGAPLPAYTGAKSNWEFFVKYAVDKWGGSIKKWEIGNEQNGHPFWGMSDDPLTTTATYPIDPASVYGKFITKSVGRYLSVLKTAFTSITAKQSGCTVIVGGLAPNDNAYGYIGMNYFLNELYRQGGKPYFHAVGAHPYINNSVDISTDSAFGDGWWQTKEVRNIMVANGDSAKKVFLTEFGYFTGTGPGAVSEAVQSAQLRAAVPFLLGQSWVGGLYLYSLIDKGTLPLPAGQESHFGLLTPAATPQGYAEKPAYGAVAGLVIPS